MYEHAFDVSPDGRLIAYVTADANFALHNGVVELGSGDVRFAMGPAVDVDAAHWSADSQWLATNEPGTGVTILDAAGNAVAFLPERDGYSTLAARFTPDGTGLVAMEVREAEAGITEAARLSVWDWRSETVIRTIDTPVNPGNRDLEIDPTGRRAATGDGRPAIWDLESGAHIDLEGLTDVHSVAFSPDGTQVAVVDQTSVALFDSATGQLHLELRGDGTTLARLAFSPDGKKVAANGLGGARVWAVDVDDLIGIAQRELTRTWTDAECQRFLHLEHCAP